MYVSCRVLGKEYKSFDKTSSDVYRLRWLGDVYYISLKLTAAFMSVLSKKKSAMLTTLSKSVQKVDKTTQNYLHENK